MKITFFSHILVQVRQERVAVAALEQSGNSRVDGILVLLKPAAHVVWHRAGVVVQLEVRLWFVLARLRLTEVRVLTQVVVVQLLLEGLITGLRDDTLFFQDREDTHRLFDQINASLQVKTEVDHFPLNTLLLVLFLLQHKHVMVEELLQTLVGVVDAKLFESVELLAD